MLAEIIAGTTARIKGTIQDDLGVAVEPTTLVYTLYAIDGDTKTILNSRNNTALTPATDAPSGALSVKLVPADNVFSNANNTDEVHRIRYKFTYNAGADTGIDYFTFRLVSDGAPTS